MSYVNTDFLFTYAVQNWVIISAMSTMSWRWSKRRYQGVAAQVTIESNTWKQCNIILSQALKSKALSTRVFILPTCTALPRPQSMRRAEGDANRHLEQVEEAAEQGLTLVHLPAQPEPFLT
jgi:hypothetical protein